MLEKRSICWYILFHSFERRPLGREAILADGAVHDGASVRVFSGPRTASVREHPVS